MKSLKVKQNQLQIEKKIVRGVKFIFIQPVQYKR